MYDLSEINIILKSAGSKPLEEKYVQKTNKDEEYGVEYNADYIEFEPEMRFIDKDDVEWIVVDVNNGKVLLLSKNGEYEVFSEDDLNLEIDLENLKPIFDDRFYTKDDYKRATGKDFLEEEMLNEESKTEVSLFDKLLKLHKEHPEVDIRTIANKVANGNIEEYIKLMKEYFEKFEK
jgi:hypothetical protein